MRLSHVLEQACTRSTHHELDTILDYEPLYHSFSLSLSLLYIYIHEFSLVDKGKEHIKAGISEYQDPGT